MARPKSDVHRVRRSYSLAEEVAKTVDKLNQKTGITCSRIVERALRMYFYTHKDILEKNKFETFAVKFMKGG